MPDQRADVAARQGHDQDRGGAVRGKHRREHDVALEARVDAERQQQRQHVPHDLLRQVAEHQPRLDLPRQRLREVRPHCLDRKSGGIIGGHDVAELLTPHVVLRMHQRV